MCQRPSSCLAAKRLLECGDKDDHRAGILIDLASPRYRGILAANWSDPRVLESLAWKASAMELAAMPERADGSYSCPRGACWRGSDGR